MKLSEHLVKNKARVSDIRNIKQLNIWGCQLTDISLFLQIPFIEVLVLGNNQITSLHALRNCHSLRHLYLGKNMIESFEELKHLKEAKSLVLLSLRDNPCSLAAGNRYRISVLRILPQLKTLDDVDFTLKERQLLAQERRTVENENNQCVRINRYQLDYLGAADQEHKTTPSQAGIHPKVVPSIDTMRGARRRNGSVSMASFPVNSSSIVPTQSAQDCSNPSNHQEHPQHSSNSCQSGRLTARDRAIASASACVNAVSQRREQELRDTISQFYPDVPDQEHRDRNASLLMAALALAKQMDATTLEVLCRAIQDQVLRPPS